MIVVCVVYASGNTVAVPMPTIDKSAEEATDMILRVILYKFKSDLREMPNMIQIENHLIMLNTVDYIYCIETTPMSLDDMHKIFEVGKYKVGKYRRVAWNDGSYADEFSPTRIFRSGAKIRLSKEDQEATDWIVGV
jgi:hypothetical protein